MPGGTLIPDRNQGSAAKRDRLPAHGAFLRLRYIRAFLHLRYISEIPFSERNERFRNTCDTYNRLCDYRIWRPSYNCNGCKRSHAHRTGVRSRSIRKSKCHSCIENRLRNPQGGRTHGSRKGQGTVELRVGSQLRLRKVKKRLTCL
jgi:transposase-like protein